MWKSLTLCESLEINGYSFSEWQLCRNILGLKLLSIYYPETESHVLSNNSIWQQCTFFFRRKITESLFGFSPAQIGHFWLVHSDRKEHSMHFIAPLVCMSETHQVALNCVLKSIKGMLYSPSRCDPGLLSDFPILHDHMIQPTTRILAIFNTADLEEAPKHIKNQSYPEQLNCTCTSPPWLTIIRVASSGKNQPWWPEKKSYNDPKWCCVSTWFELCEVYEAPPTESNAKWKMSEVNLGT